MSFKEGLQIFQAGRAMASDLRTMQDRAKAEQDEVDYNEYADLLRQGKNPEEVFNADQYQINYDAPAGGAQVDPSGQQRIGAGLPTTMVPGKKINHKMLLQAYIDDYKVKMQDQNFRAGQIKLAAAKATQAKMEFSDTIQKMDAALTAGNERLAKEMAAIAYGYINNGENIDYFPEEDKAYIMEDGPNGELVKGEEVKLPSWNILREQAKTLMQEGEFEKLHMQNQWKNKAYNMQAGYEAQWVVDAKGNDVGLMIAGVDETTGKPNWRISFNDTEGVDMDWLEARQKGYMLRSEYERRQEQKVGLESKRATARQKAREGWSPERKKAADLVETIGTFRKMPQNKAIDTAMRYVEKVKNAKNIQAAYKILDELLLDDGEKAQFMRAIRAELPTEKPTRREIAQGMGLGFEGYQPDVVSDLLKSGSGLPGKTKTGTARKTKRADGTTKGPGYFGEIELPSGDVASEYSIGVNIDGKETQIPTLVPTLSKEELELMINDIIPNNKKIPERIIKKAIAHAKERMAKEKSVFKTKDDTELVMPQLNITSDNADIAALKNEYNRYKADYGAGKAKQMMKDKYPNMRF